MSESNQSLAIGVLNEMVAAALAGYDLMQEIERLSAQWTNLGVANVANAMPTAAITATGGIGTVDASPVTSHPVNTGVAPATGINVAMSANDYASLMTILQGWASALGGSAVAADGAVSQIIALCLNPAV